MMLTAKRVLILAVAGSAAVFAAVEAAKVRLGPPPLANAEGLSTTVVDRNGRLLRAFTTPDGRWRMPVEPEDVEPRYFDILKAFEDRRFESHGGVDPIGMMRAAYQAVRHGRLVSGGSTLTMQVARLLEGRHGKDAKGKFRQMVRALQLEEDLSKRDILRLYLRLAPFGGNIEGVRAASLAYYGKEPKRLSVGEAALLVALPQSPETRRPDRNWPAALRARNRVLDRAFEVGVISAAERDRAKEEPVPKGRRAFPKFAPHLSESEVAARPSLAVHELSLDRDVQSAFETLAAEQTKLLGEKLSSAILAVDNTSGEVLAYVGSAGYLDAERAGAIDMVQAVRSPGSTLKPLIYGLAFEAGLAHPETLIDDKPTRFGSYSPENFDEEFHGTVTVREALGLSLNVPAVKMLAAVGPGKLTARLDRAGVKTELPPETVPSLAVALGGIGMRLWDLTQLYTAMARGGEPVPLTWRRDGESLKLRLAASRDFGKKRLMSPVAAWYVGDVLKDAPAPLNARGGRLAYKTGTSYGYRDAWAVGYDGRHTVAVWVGRPDGASVPGLMGRLAAAPILFDAFQRISEKRTPLRAPPAGVIKKAGANLPPPLKRFREGPDDTPPAGPFLDKPPLIAFPPDRSELDVAERDAEDPVVLKAEGGALPLTWLVDGAPVPVDGNDREVAWTPPGKGFVRLQVIDAKGRADRVTVRLR
jgi:penicillin-binding protein 1C